MQQHSAAPTNPPSSGGGGGSLPPSSGSVLARPAEAVLPIAFGSAAFLLPVDQQSVVGVDATHTWTLYVRGMQGQDLSPILKKATFTLHTSCKEPKVERTSPPYETQQSGWGEFIANIALEFRDEAAPSVSSTHSLQLFGDPAKVTSEWLASHPNTSVSSLARPVMNESYDEVVFQSTNLEFLQRVRDVASARPTPQQEHFLAPFWKPSPEEAVKKQLQAIAQAHTFVKQQLNAVVSDLGHVESEIARVKRAKIEKAAAAQQAANEAAAAAKAQALLLQQQQQLAEASAAAASGAEGATTLPPVVVKTEGGADDAALTSAAPADPVASG